MISEDYKIVLVAASSTLAQSYIKERLKFLEKKNVKDITIYLIGRNSDNLINIKTKLQKKNLKTEIYITDFKKVDEEYISYIKNLDFDEIVLAQGQLTDQERFINEKSYLLQDLSINLVSFIMTINISAETIIKNKKGIIIVFGSIAGDLGKKSNYTYSFTKSAIENYLQGLKHRYPNINILLVKPGLTKTKMTINLSTQSLLWSEPEQIAKDINNALNSKKFQIYSPWWWKYIILILKFIPKKILYKLNI